MALLPRNHYHRSVPIKKSRRLPKKFARQASPDTKRFVKRRMERRQKKRIERWKRFTRRAEAMRDSITEHAFRTTLIAVVLLLLTVLGFILFSPIMHVRSIQVTRVSPRLDIEEVQDALSPMFGRHILFLSSFEIAGLLRDRIPDVRNVKTSKRYPSTLKVQIELDPLVARLHIQEPDAGDTAEIGTGTTIDFLTDTGMYIATLAARDVQTLPEIVVVDWGLRPEPDTRLLTTAFLERMKAAELTLLRQFGQEVERRTVYVRAQEFHLRVSNISLWFDLKSPLEDQLERYHTFLRDVSLEKVKQYIDLRLADRVVWQ